MKIQLAIEGVGAGSQVLIYNRAKSIYFETALTSALKEMMGDEVKVYAAASIDETNLLNIAALVDEQPW